MLPFFLNSFTSYRLPHFYSASNRSIFTVDSSSVARITHTALKTLPYILWSKPLGMNTVGCALGTRLSYLEDLACSSVALMLELTWVFLAFIVTLATFGQFESVNLELQKRSFNVAYSFFGFAINSCGIISPSLGVYLGYLLIWGSIRAIIDEAKQDLRQGDEERILNALKEGWINREGAIINFIQPFFTSFFPENPNLFNERISPFIQQIGHAIKVAKSLEELKGLLSNVLFPQKAPS